MSEGTKRIGAARLLWSLILGLGLALGLLWALMPHSTVEAQSGGPGRVCDLDGNFIHWSAYGVEGVKLPMAVNYTHGRSRARSRSYSGDRGGVYDLDGDFIDWSFYGVEGVELPMAVNYAHDWMEARSLPGYTAVVTVADVSGVKATLQAQADDEGRIRSWEWDWMPTDPDIEPGDMVTVASIGYVGTVNPVGTITGELDADNDTISGTIYAPWFSPQTLDVECMVWVEFGPDSIEVPGVAADGGSYFCDFSGRWDIEPGQYVAVSYREPDGSEVINVFMEPAPDMRVEKWREGSEVTPDGPVVFTIRYENEGDAEAATVLLTDTLPANTTYVTDSSGFPANVGPGLVTWSFGPVAPGDGVNFQIVLTNTASPSDTLHNEVDIDTLYDYEDWNDHNETEVHVTEGQPDLYVSKDRWPWDPVPGQTFLYEIDYGNNGPVASGPVVLTDTLPGDTTIVSWYSENGYNLWREVTASGDQLVLAAPTVPGNWGDRILLRLRVGAGVSTGTQLTNTVEITTAGDSDPNNNWHLRDDTWVGWPRWDVYMDKGWNWGQLVPGGRTAYYIDYGNGGNMSTQAWLTDTLPAGTTFVTSTHWTGYGEVPVAPSYVDDDIVVWDVGVLEPGEWNNFDIRVVISATVAPNTAITNCATIAMAQSDSWPYNNAKCAVETVRAAGPSLRVRKEAWWDWEGQIRYQTRFENIGTTRMEDIWITDTYPISTTFNDDWRVRWGPSVTATHDASNRQLIFWAEDLGPGDTGSVGFRVDLDDSIHGVQGLVFTNTVEAPWPGDVYPADNRDVELAYTGPDVYIEKWLSGGEPEPGEIVTFTVEFGNRNLWPWDGDDEYGSHITDTLPAAMEFITATAPWDRNQRWVPEDITGTTVRWGWVTMWSDSTWQFDIIARITDTVEGGDVLTNRIEAYGDSPYDIEPYYDNNVSSATVTLPKHKHKLYLPLVLKGYP